jgi:CheY-like chemotaxis protein
VATILVVDTNPADRRWYITLLGNYGHRLLEAADGVEALALAQVELPELIITDILMPHMDGFTSVRRLRGNLCWRHSGFRPPTMMCLKSTGWPGERSTAYPEKGAEPQEILRAVNESLKPTTPGRLLKQTTPARTPGTAG